MFSLNGTLKKKWVGQVMGNEIIYWDGLNKKLESKFLGILMVHLNFVKFCRNFSLNGTKKHSQELGFGIKLTFCNRTLCNVATERQKVRPYSTKVQVWFWQCFTFDSTRIQINLKILWA